MLPVGLPAMVDALPRWSPVPVWSCLSDLELARLEFVSLVGDFMPRWCLAFVGKLPRWSCPVGNCLPVGAVPVGAAPGAASAGSWPLSLRARSGQCAANKILGVVGLPTM